MPRRATGYLGTTLAVGALTALSPNESRDALLRRVAAGAAVAFASGFTASGGVVSGRAEFVPDAEGAEVVLLLADDDGVPVVVTSSGLSVTAQPVLDETRSLAVVTADGAAVSESWPLVADPGDVARPGGRRGGLRQPRIGEAMLAATVDYAKVRHQFGRPIGSFQAVKHACADMLVQIVRGATAGRAPQCRRWPTAPTQAVAASMAKSYACGAAVDVVGKAMQLHGGIGYTWESGVHVYLKRAALNRSLFGSTASHRQRLAARYQ